MKRVIRFALVVLFVATVCLSSRPAQGAPFVDVHDDHWAAEAIRQLADKGLVEGLDGKHFFGDRALSRYEMAKVVARLLVKMEELARHGHADLATKGDLELIRKLANEFRDELDAMKVRVQGIEEEIDRLERRAGKVEEVRIYSLMDTIGNAQSVNKRGPNFRQAFDFTNGRPLAPGLNNNNFVTGVATVGVEADLSHEYRGGVELAAYGLTGLTTAGLAPSYWGVTPPYSNNWWTGQMVSSNLSLERAWVEHRPSETMAAYGAFNPRKFAPHVVKGEPNPTFYGPEYLPMFGVTSSGPLDFMKIPFVTWEVIAGEIPNQTPYFTTVEGLHVGVDLRKVNLTLQYASVQNDSTSAALVPVLTPFSNPFRLVDPTGGQFLNTGVQGQNMYGFTVEPRLFKDHQLKVEFAASQYNPDKTKLFSVSPHQRGALLRAHAEGPLWGGRYGADFLSVDPTYDPFILGYPGNAVVRNWAIWNNISNFYFIHDTVTYPHNREGFRLEYSHGIPWGQVYVFGSSLRQKHSTNDLFTNFPVHIEPTFGASPNFGITAPVPFLSNNKGRINTVGVQFALSPIRPLRANIGFSHTDLTRDEDTTLANNVLAGGRENWASRSNNLSVNLDYAISSRVSAQLDFNRIDFGGTINGFGGYAVNQTILGLGLSYAITSNAALAIGYRHYATAEFTPNRTSYPSSNQGIIYGDSNAQMFLTRLKMNF